jgi:kynurenine formamidase
MKIYDVTVPISEQVPIYEGDPRVSFETSSTIAGGDSANVSKMCLGVHTPRGGTGYRKTDRAVQGGSSSN